VLGEKIMSALKQIDEIAYIRFASVYRRFKDAEELISEMRGLIDEETKEPGLSS
jgi:transcriptional repressor NrdR